MKMFCYQCEQTIGGEGCTTRGACGKDAETAALQDLLVHLLKGLSFYGRRAAARGAYDVEAENLLLEGMFSTLTNVNFDPARFEQWIGRAAEAGERLRRAYEKACAEAGETPERPGGGPAEFRPADDRAGMLEQAKSVSLTERIERLGREATGLQYLITTGVKGVAAYGYHAGRLGKDTGEIARGVYELLDFVARESTDTEELLSGALACGELNLKAMEALDAANMSAYGHPRPTRVRVEPEAGKAILVSGHDLKDLQELLEQTAGLDINVYTHGEMLPAHGYPGLKKHPHLVGNYGGAWQNQRREFAAFPGAILMTTNCIQRPKDEYRDRIFTCGPTGWPGVRHIEDGDFSPVIEAAKKAPGFAEDGPETTIIVGHAREAVMASAAKIVAAVKAGKIRHFFLVGGCDGARPQRNYYTEFARMVPKDCVILTLGCGKYRFNKLDFGEIDGVPRLLDLGQCNDAYSAIRIAAALAEAFDTGINDLPLSLILSWFEQKAVAILLTLLHLNVKNIRLGPSTPAFLTPAILEALSEKYGLRAVTTPERDLADILE